MTTPNQYNGKGRTCYKLLRVGVKAVDGGHPYGCSPYRFFMKKHFEDSEEEENKTNWLAVRDHLEQLIEPAKDWTDADCLSDLNEIAQHFINAYPDVSCTVQDLRLALHDLNINLERNEHNQKYYYLAKWK